MITYFTDVFEIKEDISDSTSNTLVQLRNFAGGLPTIKTSLDYPISTNENEDTSYEIINHNY